MALYQKMGLKQSMELRMTPQLQQAIKLLQLSRLELEKAVQKEIEENPILEEVVDQQGDDPAKNMEGADATPTTEAIGQDVQDPRKQDEFEWENYVETQYKPPAGVGGPNSDEIMNYENVISSKQTLYDHLMWQLNMNGFNEEEMKIAAILIGYIDDDGYIKTPLEQIAEEEGVSVQDLEDVLPFVQEFDPPGVGARTLEECLLIQAKHIQEDTNDLVHIIQNHIKDLEKKNYDRVAKEMNIPLEQVFDLCKIITDMDPKPGRAFSTQEVQYVTPDVYVYKVADEYAVSLNEDGLPRLKVSNLYKNILSGKDSSMTQDYIKDKLKSAVWLIKSIHQRQRTIYKVTEAIVKYQKEFFDKGAAFIRPMILRDIANEVGIHESTVSRVTTNKYVHTPQGIFELKYFFNSGVSKTDGDSLASESVKLKIKDLVAKENPKKPLSDQELVNMLKSEGIQIARRTVAKYRDALGVLPSSKRKKMF